MRGKAVVFHSRDRSAGITPAYAGKRQGCTGSVSGNQDHPRLCGEKVDTEYRDKSIERITPAYAGKSTRQKPTTIARQDHPRLCGEKHEKHVPAGRI